MSVRETRQTENKRLLESVFMHCSCFCFVFLINLRRHLLELKLEGDFGERDVFTGDSTWLGTTTSSKASHVQCM